MEHFSIQKDGSFVILDKKGIHKKPLSLLEVIICDKPYLKLYVNNQLFQIEGSIKSIAGFLPSSFIQVNRKVVVNELFIKEILKKGNQYELHTVHDQLFEISQRRCNQVLSAAKKLFELNGSTGSGGTL